MYLGGWGAQVLDDQAGWALVADQPLAQRAELVGLPELADDARVV